MAEHTYPPPVSDQTRTEVWGKAHGAEYAERYFQTKGNQYLKYHRRLTYATIGLGGGAVVPAALAIFSDAGNHAWIGLVLGIVGVLLAAVSIAGLVGDYARKASVATFVARTCGRAARECRDLLNAIDLYQVEDDEARAQLTRLATLVDNETYNTEAFGIEVDNECEDSKKAENEARAHLESLYAAC